MAPLSNIAGVPAKTPRRLGGHEFPAETDEQPGRPLSAVAIRHQMEATREGGYTKCLAVTRTDPPTTFDTRGIPRNSRYIPTCGLSAPRDAPRFIKATAMGAITCKGPLVGMCRQTLSRRGVEGNAYAQHGSEVPWMAYRSAILYRKSMRQDTIHGAGFESCRLDNF